ncbi:nucleolar complex protein 2, putative [Plasmodium berghei]|uniref:Nucleolar complex protein 2, putative n=2 Tax=Plasmodium berghei TaxID=5821 RepID=A0A509ATC5_PLABA|nr:nucleolar complex protein 2, putative [Plasmodium berghei ANKA]CXJ02550.1 nucleolar complex protein 2, putative [Plasmodium berghei]SCL98327.1 nucleolar complex protein 2, putative [Plasmodium berghei]SCM16810.1 nucleolar complex protein 2, putative [Plasmodium berghei]SCM18608.1 nucleolar complex protein 2, putative [Plasmodium berghei]SCN28043.1 nucleolar complex protein 2, putative [Plasmodium berghei]|eukprot:XP_034423694.1 nucleolar complex protein 2, putative [Plasmodium berghei ANKA]
MTEVTVADTPCEEVAKIEEEKRNDDIEKEELTVKKKKNSKLNKKRKMCSVVKETKMKKKKKEKKEKKKKKNEDEEVGEDEAEVEVDEGIEEMEYDDITELENFCKKYNIDNENSSSDEDMENPNDELLLGDEDGQNGERTIDINYVHNFLESINKKVRLNKVVKLLAIFEDALNLYHIEEIDDGYSKMKTNNSNEQNDNANNEENKTMKKKKRNKKGDNNKKRNFRMNVDTSVYIIFNVLYNINNIFYNIMNDGNLNINIISLNDIKNNKIVESEYENNEKDMNKSDIIYDLENMSKYKHINRYTPCIIYFFNKIIVQLNKLKNCNDIFLSILKIIKRKENLRWVVILNYGKIFLKKISHLFIFSKKSEIYFLLYILIQNMFQLYNERKRIIFTNLSKTKYEDENNQIKNTYDMEKLLYGIYQHIFQTYLTHYGPKSDNIINWNHIHFKENCLVELFTYLSHDVAYNIAFRYIQLIIQKIREEFKIVFDEKRNEKCKEKKNKLEKNIKTKYLYLEQLRLHTPQMIIILKFLMKVTKQCDNLNILTYGLTTLIIGILKMKINNMRYLPFNLQLINFLIRIMEDKKKYIPLFSYLACILNGLKNYKNNKNVSKDQKTRLVIENFDINSNVQIDEKLISDFSISYQIYDKIYVILFDYIGLIANHISFPEFFFAIENFFKKYYLECQVPTFKSQIKKLLTHAKSSIDFILNKRKYINIYTIHDKMTYFENEKLPLSTQRLTILENYENSYLEKIKAKLSGMENIKNADSDDDNNSDLEKEQKEKKTKKNKNKKNKKNKKTGKNNNGDNKNDDNNDPGVEKNGNLNALSKEDKVEEFSLSSEDENTK